MSFVHLHTHSEFSLLDGAARVGDLAARAAELGMPALALTDHGYMYGAADFYRAAVSAGIKPLIGCEVYFTPERQMSGGKPNLYHLLLLAKNNDGYKNLMELVSNAAVDGFYYRPQVDLAALQRHSAGLIATSACMSGILSKSIELGEPDEARRWAETYASVFGSDDFYVELQNQEIVANNGVSQSQINVVLAEIANDLGLGMVATNDIHYLNRPDAEVQDMLLCINTGSTISQPGRMKFSCDQFYLKTAEEMAAALPEYPEALANTLAVAEKCNVSMEFNRIILPAFHVPDDEDENAFLRRECIEGLKVRYGDPIPDHVMQRLDDELAVVKEKGFASYFLIVADFTQWARAQGFGVGPGRGSAAGSIAAYALGITNLDPIEQGLLFERFLNPERTEMPDIDMDFDDENRGEVIEYVRRKYGAEKVAQIITFNTLKARAAIRDAGRVLGYPYSVPDKISKLIPDTPLDIKIPQALRGDKEKGIPVAADLAKAYEGDLDARRILDAAMALEGITRGEGVHAAGVVICPDPLFEHVPVKRDTKGGSVITQFDGPTVSELGLLKMDFLGLRTLSVIMHAVRAIKENHGVVIDIENLPKDDEATWELLRRADTDGVFQVESPGMKGVLRKLQPTVLPDLVAVVALFRPGPMDSIDDFVARKHGRAKVTFYDERLRYILEETYGAMVYQEQVMRISMEMAGFTAAKADKLRKAMGKKLEKEMKKLHPEFVKGSLERGYDKRVVEQLWNDIAKFAEYAFNKSHAAAYAIIAYQTAYLKAHYPLEYMAAVLGSWIGKTDKLVHYLGACHRAGIAVLPPDVNSSGVEFAVVGNAIRFSLTGIRGVGEGVVRTIVAAREESGKFASLHDFCERIDLRQANKKTLESLIKAGAFDSTGYTRRQLIELMDHAVEMGSSRQKEREVGQVSMFDLFEPEDHGYASEVPAPDGIEWDQKVKLTFEKEVLGIYVSDHPLNAIEDLVRSMAECSLGEIEDVDHDKVVWLAGLFTAVERRPTKRGGVMALCAFEDLDGAIEVIVFPQVLEKYRQLIEVDQVVRIKARVDKKDDRGIKVIALELEGFDGVEFTVPPARLVVNAPSDLLENGNADTLKKVLRHYPGRDIVEIRVVHPETGKLIVAELPERVNAEAGGLHAEILEMFGRGAIGS